MPDDIPPIRLKSTDDRCSSCGGPWPCKKCIFYSRMELALAAIVGLWLLIELTCK